MLSETLQKMNINPGNTIDSVVQEMAENLKQVSLQDIPQEVKDESLLASFNRLNYYRMACYENTYELSKKLGYKELESLLYLFPE